MNKKITKWLNSKNVSSQDKETIKQMTDSQLNFSFNGELDFGTAGIRRHMGIGSNLLNIYSIKMITYAWIKSLEKYSKEDLKKEILICHDTRNNGKEFAMTAAKVISGMGYHVLMFNQNNAVPTPITSYTIRNKKLGGGACITASHNPAIYNGYKIFDEEGKHIITKKSNAIQEFLKNIDINTDIPSSNENIKFLDESFEEKYVNDIIHSLPLEHKTRHIKIVFSPLHGASYKLAPMALKKLGFEVISEPKQSIPDGNFTYVVDPNPENPLTFDRMIKLGQKVDADVLLASDPDGDRVGIAIKNKGKYEVIGGHDIASLITHHLLSQYQISNKLKLDDSIIKTIVTTSLVEKIASDFGVKTLNALTGFKYIGEIASQTKPWPLLATEESYGASASLRLSYDKDSIQILPILADMVDYYKHQEKTLFDVKKDLLNKYSDGDITHYNEKEELMGDDAHKDLNNLINGISKLKSFEDIKINKIDDFRKGVNNFPISNLVIVRFGKNNDSWFAVRPSGTEPLMRKYYCVFSKNENESKTIIQKINNTIKKIRSKNEF